MINYILKIIYTIKIMWLIIQTNPLLSETIYDFKDGMFSGYDEKTRKYDKSKWSYKLDEEGNVLKDPSLQDPRCVFQLMKKHYARYDVDTVVGMTGTDKEDYLKSL